MACSRGARVRNRSQQSQVLGILERMSLRRRSGACWEGVFSCEPSWTDFYCLYLPVLETDEAGKDVPAKISSDSFRGYVPNRYLNAGMLMDAQHRSSAEHQSPLRLTGSKV